MKRFFIFAICFLSLQIVKAHSLTLIDTSLRLGHGDYPEKTADEAVFPAHVSSSSNSIFKLRLDSIQKDIQLDYNDYVQSYIDIYTRHKDEMSHVLGLAKYYFPIYEKVFREAGIPTEIKYLSIVESKLDPNAVSRVGATGPWQFMSTTAKIYGLNMDSYVDDRRDPIKASYAAAAYLKDAYQEFGDWLLAIASYNCGKSNVERAIEKAGGANDFWSIRQYLPAETRGYVPAYIAISYVMNYANKHNINTQNWDLSAKTDTVFVDKYISLSNVAKALNVDLTELSLLNPAYSRKIVNGTAVSPRRIIIPDVDKWNYSALYDALDGVNIPFAVKPPKPIIPVIAKVVAPVTVAPATGTMQMVQSDQPEFHKVKRGETLVDIASNYGVDISDIKAWNHLHGNKPVVGQMLKLTPM